MLPLPPTSDGRLSRSDARCAAHVLRHDASLETCHDLNRDGHSCVYYKAATDTGSCSAFCERTGTSCVSSVYMRSSTNCRASSKVTCGRRHSLACECAAPESSSADLLPADDGDADTEQSVLLLVAMPASALLLVCAGAATCYKRHATRRRALSGASCCPFPAKARRGPSTPRVSEVSLSIDYSERRASALGGGDGFSPARGSGVLSIAHASGISLSDSDAHPLDVEPCPATPPPAYVAPLADDASCSPVSALARRILDKAGATPEDRCSPEELRAAAAAAAA
ncbi:hypothetical protein EMIHUDRAFT_435146, partial [Emiliania huxleyi CCMP1516]|uniref:Apple domain-containing protein n=2 Tax=Emiliania huxleyi TaxID=2903 RepID=A0A0D3JQD2_EMIH1